MVILFPPRFFPRSIILASLLHLAGRASVLRYRRWLSQADPTTVTVLCPGAQAETRVGEVGSWHSYVVSLHKDLGAANR